MSNNTLNDMLVFELPDLDLATELTKRLAERWTCCIHEDLGVAVVSVFLLPDGDGGLAQLLRRVEAWVAARSVRFGSGWTAAPTSSTSAMPTSCLFSP